MAAPKSGAGDASGVRLTRSVVGARAVTQPWRTWSPDGFAVGTGAALVPEPGPAGAVVVVVLVAGAVVVVVLGASVVVVVVPNGLTRLMPPGTVVVVVVVVEDVVVVVGATVVVVVVVVFGVAGAPGVGDGAVPPGVLGAAAGVGAVMTAVVQAPAFCSVSTSATSRTREWLSVALSPVNVATFACNVFWTLLRCADATFTAAVAAWDCASRSDATNVAYWWATTPFWLCVSSAGVFGPLTRGLLW